MKNTRNSTSAGSRAGVGYPAALVFPAVLTLFILGACQVFSPSTPEPPSPAVEEQPTPALPTPTSEKAAPSKEAGGGETRPAPTLAPFTLKLKDFADGGEIPVKFTCKGKDLSPAMEWNTPPAGARSLALLVEDPDAPGGTFTHWEVYNLAPRAGRLPEGLPRQPLLAEIAVQGLNDFNTSGYRGPCPPAGKAHHYNFRLLALDAAPDLPAGLKPKDLRKQVVGHILAEAGWSGTFKR